MDPAMSFFLYSVGIILLTYFIGYILVFQFLARIWRFLRRDNYVKELEGAIKEAIALEKDYDKLKKEHEGFVAKTTASSLYSRTVIAERIAASWRDYVLYGCITSDESVHYPLYELEERGLQQVALKSWPKSIMHPKGKNLANNDPFIVSYVDPKLVHEAGDSIYRSPALTVNGKGRFPIEGERIPPMNLREKPRHNNGNGKRHHTPDRRDKRNEFFEVEEFVQGL